MSSTPWSGPPPERPREGETEDDVDAVEVETGPTASRRYAPAPDPAARVQPGSSDAASSDDDAIAMISARPRTRRGGVTGSEVGAYAGAEAAGGAVDEPGTAPSRKSRAGRNLPQAIGVGVIMGALAAGSLAFHPVAFLVLAIVASVWATSEVTTACRAADLHASLPVTTVGAVIIPLAAYYGDGRALFGAFALACVACLCVAGAEASPTAGLRGAATGIFALTYVPLLVGVAMLMLSAERGISFIVAYIAMTVASDIGGYAAGVSFGSHPMAPGVSPGKTWEGLAGSVATAMVVGCGCAVWGLGAPWYLGLLAGAATAVAATVGDLAESLVKRDLGIKDMGTRLPGHGGLMDRMDSLLVAAPVAYAAFIGAVL